MRLDSNTTNDNNNNDNINDDIGQEFMDFVNGMSGNAVDDLLEIISASDGDIPTTIPGTEDIRRNSTSEIMQRIADEQRQESMNAAIAESESEVRHGLEDLSIILDDIVDEGSPSTSLNSHSSPSDQGHSR